MNEFLFKQLIHLTIMIYRTSKSSGMDIWKEVEIVFENWQKVAHAYGNTWWAYMWLYEMMYM